MTFFANDTKHKQLYTIGKHFSSWARIWVRYLSIHHRLGQIYDQRLGFHYDGSLKKVQVGRRSRHGLVEDLIPVDWWCNPGDPIVRSPRKALRILWRCFASHALIAGKWRLLWRPLLGNCGFDGRQTQICWRCERKTVEDDAASVGNNAHEKQFCFYHVLSLILLE